MERAVFLVLVVTIRHRRQRYARQRLASGHAGLQVGRHRGDTTIDKEEAASLDEEIGLIGIRDLSAIKKGTAGLTPAWGRSFIKSTLI